MKQGESGIGEGEEGELALEVTEKKAIALLDEERTIESYSVKDLDMYYWDGTK